MIDILTVKDAGVILRQKSENVTKEDLIDLKKTINDMQQALPLIGGVGLSACQVGLLKRFFILSDGEVYINPVVIARSGKITSIDEGCLSLPGKYFTVKRSRTIIIDYMDRYGNEKRKKFAKKILAIAVQHELDHLNGILLCDI